MAITDPKIDALLAAERSRQETLASDEAARAEAAEEARDAEARSDLAGDVLEESELEFQPSTPEVYEGWTSPGPGVPPLSGRVKMTSGFGSRKPPVEGASRWHGALDFGAPQGSPVYSMRSGKVVFAGPAGGHGNRVIIRFYDGVTVAYSHLDSVDVKAGQRVVMGQPVGGVGSTGVSTGPHLHLEVAAPGRNILKAKERGNPTELLPELSHAKDEQYYDFGEAPIAEASNDEIDALSRKFKSVWRRWISEGKPESMGYEFDDAYEALRSVGVDPVDVATTVRDYDPAPAQPVDPDEEALKKSMLR
tara:strand:- start:494 stop:1411 length:918 start_codon:yes stop_codon:yes gene_type:complete